MSQNTMLEFYQQHAISPVAQDISDLQAHFNRRAHLYRSLGLPPMALRDRRVLEVGPGGGHNALYTMSLQPNQFVLVEPNEASVREMPPALAYGHNRNVDVRRCAIENYTAYDPFDVVICEGLLGLCGSDPKVLLEHLVKHVKVGGVLVITCIDAISDHSEVLRRAMAQKYINPSMSLQEKVDVLRPVFTPHLETLKGMTRSVEDWIIDNILNPASIGPTFSIPDALTALEGRFEVLGCNPRFLMDWRWYKEAEQGNTWAIEAYWRQCYNLYDYRHVWLDAPREENQELMEECLQVRAQVALLEQGVQVDVDTSAVEHDIAWFGRGQQYLSLVRTHAQ